MVGKLASMVSQLFLCLNCKLSNCCMTTFSYNMSVAGPYGQKLFWQYRYHLLNISVNGHSMMFLRASWIIDKQITVSNQNLSINCLYGQKYYIWYCYYIVEMFINSVSTILDLESWMIWVLWNSIEVQFTLWRDLWVKMLVTILNLHLSIKHPLSIVNYCRGSVRYTAMKCIGFLPNSLVHGQSVWYVLVYNLTIMHAKSYRLDFLACRSEVDI